MAEQLENKRPFKKHILEKSLTKHVEVKKIKSLFYTLPRYQLWNYRYVGIIKDVKTATKTKFHELTANILELTGEWKVISQKML